MDVSADAGRLAWLCGYDAIFLRTRGRKEIIKGKSERERSKKEERKGEEGWEEGGKEEGGGKKSIRE